MSNSGHGSAKNYRGSAKNDRGFAKIERGSATLEVRERGLALHEKLRPELEQIRRAAITQAYKVPQPPLSSYLDIDFANQHGQLALMSVGGLKSCTKRTVPCFNKKISDNFLHLAPLLFCSKAPAIALVRGYPRKIIEFFILDLTP